MTGDGLLGVVPRYTRDFYRDAFVTSPDEMVEEVRYLRFWTYLPVSVIAILLVGIGGYVGLYAVSTLGVDSQPAVWAVEGVVQLLKYWMWITAVGAVAIYLKAVLGLREVVLE